jgi:hypothetical protein
LETVALTDIDVHALKLEHDADRSLLLSRLAGTNGGDVLSPSSAFMILAIVDLLLMIPRHW